MKFTAEEIQNLAAEFEGRAPREILQWAADSFSSRVAISSAFGPEGLVVIDIAMRKVTPRIPVFTIDTGFFFKETVELIYRIEQEYGITIERLHPELTPEQQAEKYGARAVSNASRTSAATCARCFRLQKKLPELDALVTGLRRSQGESRQGREDPAIAGDAREAIAISRSIRWRSWTKEEVWWYIISHQLHYNPLHDQGYPSIGCWPDCCTRPVKDGEGERAGRWAGSDKKECGLHTFAANI